MKIKSVKLMGLGLAGVLALTSVVAMADSQNAGKGFGRGMMMAQKGARMNDMTAEERLAKLKENLDKQVADGKITQEKADEIYAQCESGNPQGLKMGFGKKELTDEEKAQMKADRLAKLKENLDKQVADGKLTQEKADEIYAKAETGNFQRPADVFTDEEKADMKAKMLADMKEKLDAKVAAGTITQEQADEVYARAENGNFGFGPMGGGQMRGPMGRGRGMNNCKNGNAPGKIAE